jgi:small subunit ribosomal protein S13
MEKHLKNIKINSKIKVKLKSNIKSFSKIKKIHKTNKINKAHKARKSHRGYKANKIIKKFIPKRYKDLKNIKRIKKFNNFKRRLRKKNFGIGRFALTHIQDHLGINKKQKVILLRLRRSPAQSKGLESLIETYTNKFRLRGKVKMAAYHYLKLKNYRGFRHMVGLPVRGQRTKTNSKTRKKSFRLSLI